MKRISMYQNGEYRYDVAAKSIKEIVREIRFYGWMYHNDNGTIKQTPVQPSDEITGKIICTL